MGTKWRNSGSAMISGCVHFQRIIWSESAYPRNSVPEFLPRPFRREKELFPIVS